jgi:hypothetical protein
MSQSPIPFNEGVDLHAHTTASDGSLTPTQLIDKAAALGLRAIGVTDHDTIGGLAEARAAAAGKIEFVPGVELSTEDENGRFHMLGYLFDQDNAVLAETLEDLRRRRAARNEKIMAKVREYNMPLAWDDVLAELKEGSEIVARPHIASAMLKKGIVATKQEAFDKWLANDRPLYFSKGGLTPKDAIALLHQAGGIAVMAHPALTKWSDPVALEAYLALVKEDGLDALEVYYSQHSPEQTEAYAAIADRLRVIATGGSDFHGDPKPHVTLGIVTNGGPAPYHILESMRRAAG